MFFFCKQATSQSALGKSIISPLPASFLRGWNVDISNLNVTWCSFLQASPDFTGWFDAEAGDV